MNRLTEFQVTDSDATRAGLAERRGSAAGQAGAGALVGIAKSAAVLGEKSPLKSTTSTEGEPRELRTVVDEETGEVLTFEWDAKTREWRQAYDPSAVRLERFLLQGAARRLLQGRETPRGARWRLCSCCVRRFDADEHVKVMYSAEVKRASFANLVMCASVWVCMVCSSKITERRKVEVVGAAALHRAGGGQCYMVTLTWAHTRVDDLAQMLEAASVATRRLRRHRSYQERCEWLGYVGMIRALEVTHGEANGWHPHFHELWFLDRRLSRDDLRAWHAKLFDEWHAQCARAGLGLPNRRFGVDIRVADDAAGDYITKWGVQQKWNVAAELAKAVTKRGRNGSRSPWDLLRLAADGSSRHGSLWVSYADAFYGARQLFWSPGLKAALGVAEKTDQEVAEEVEAEAELVCSVSPADWNLVLRQPYEARAQLLSQAESGGAGAVEAYLSTLRGSSVARGAQRSLWALGE